MAIDLETLVDSVVGVSLPMEETDDGFTSELRAVRVVDADPESGELIGELDGETIVFEWADVEVW